MTPLAELLRPKTLDEVVGQKHLIGKEGWLVRAIEKAHPLSGHRKLKRFFDSIEQVLSVKIGFFLNIQRECTLFCLPSRNPMDFMTKELFSLLYRIKKSF